MCRHCREVCEVVISNEALSRPLDGPGIEVEIDETYLTRRKYKKGRKTKTGSVTILGLYERETKLGFHLQVKNKSKAVLLSEIERLVLPGTKIITDAMPSYADLPKHGYEHDFVVHKRRFVQKKDRSVHNQNIEIRNRWTKTDIKSYGSDRQLHSYCAQYAYRYWFLKNMDQQWLPQHLQLIGIIHL